MSLTFKKKEILKVDFEIVFFITHIKRIKRRMKKNLTNGKL